MASFLHQSQVQYGDNQFALTPWQMLPVWDVKRWSLFRMFTAVSTNAIQHGGGIVALSGHPTPVPITTLEGLYHKWVEAENQQLAGETPEAANQADMHLRGKLSTTTVGNAGGQRIVQPDMLPIGCMPMKGRVTHRGSPTWVQHNMSMWDWISWVAILDDNNVVRIPERVLDKPLEIGFFVQDRGGLRGWNTETEEMGEFRKIPLPFSWQSAEELELIPEASDIYEASEEGSTLAMSLSAQVRRLAMKEGWQGHIFVGISDPNSSTVERRHVPVDEARSKWKTWGALSEMAYVPDNPWSALDYGAAAKVRKLLALDAPQMRVAPALAAAASKFWVR